MPAAVRIASLVLHFIIWALLPGDRCALAQLQHIPHSQDTVRTVAVTIDDLPTVGVRTLEGMQNLTTRLLDQITAHRIPAIGFVNEHKLGGPAPQPERIALLEQWLDAGLELGNHTYAHPSLYDTPLEAFQENVLRGDEVIARLMNERGQSPRYFRHPYLNTGPDLPTKTAFESFLTRHHYTVAPVTIDNADFLYALAYYKADAAGDRALMDRIGADYVRYMEQMFAFFEQLSRDVLGREPAQILLLHANTLNADYLDELVAMMKARGYQFVSLDQAMQDPAYALPDTFIARHGVSWLQRWLVTSGGAERKEPQAAGWVTKIAYPDRD